jgi:site-specific DNA-methyltransferase (adenine-specific)
MYLGDSIDVLPALGADAQAHVMITDPPYSAHVHSPVWARRRGTEIVRERVVDFDCMTRGVQDQVAQFAAKLVARWSLIFSNVELVGDWIAAIESSALRYVRTCAWYKPRATPQFSSDRPGAAFEMIVLAHPSGKMRWNGGGTRNVWPAELEGPGDCPVFEETTEYTDRVHTTQKPIRLMLRMVELFSDAGETVLDPFAGSATTGVACLRLGRRFVGIERDPKYFALACARLRAEEQHTTLAGERAGQVPLFGGD